MTIKRRMIAGSLFCVGVLAAVYPVWVGIHSLLYGDGEELMPYLAMAAVNFAIPFSIGLGIAIFGKD